MKHSEIYVVRSPEKQGGVNCHCCINFSWAMTWKWGSGLFGALEENSVVFLFQFCGWIKKNDVNNYLEKGDRVAPSLPFPPFFPSKKKSGGKEGKPKQSVSAPCEGKVHTETHTCWVMSFHNKEPESCKLPSDYIKHFLASFSLCWGWLGFSLAYWI